MGVDYCWVDYVGMYCWFSCVFWFGVDWCGENDVCFGEVVDFGIGF